jgi:hypothetical protein
MFLSRVPRQADTDHPSETNTKIKVAEQWCQEEQTLGHANEKSLLHSYRTCSIFEET